MAAGEDGLLVDAIIFPHSKEEMPERVTGVEVQLEEQVMENRRELLRPVAEQPLDL
jgi:hypothetical protein